MSSERYQKSTERIMDDTLVKMEMKKVDSAYSEVQLRREIYQDLTSNLVGSALSYVPGTHAYRARHELQNAESTLELRLKDLGQRVDELLSEMDETERKAALREFRKTEKGRLILAALRTWDNEKYAGVIDDRKVMKKVPSFVKEVGEALKRYKRGEPLNKEESEMMKEIENEDIG